ncbi:medium-chain acyl-CoA ligase ACSF2, mitochondrial-like [Amphibalanus amphitrite]|uniref:medium-chain acyl-CoA ligase ACSF2, mitochondrial-like n=1 Tax=Amphibalanus amphitrite TaxID=1232801 RepID=UPI001C91818B|nr:medium-chain acyl-CoA ligase ACSF2, mitochondrial-like [Amphibalanus amphitrite]XP_043223812.1 medium-chain acyl-CoA ligase ACSF2, mitochondrial-like [Amphibalanus amphitrite]XP_043223813.1 medium-chain acyl-CoA ligase ACSF2, mitochondrial-like [Amphibalanus amphitrite]
MALGLEFGDRIGIWGTNVYEWQLTQYAAAKAGLALVNVNQAYQTNELEYCLKKVGVKTLVATDGYKTSDYYDMLTRLLPELTSEGESNVPLTLRSERLPQLRSVVMISQQRRRGVLRFDDLLDSGMESLSGELQRRQAQVNCDDHCSIQFTSGTTGLPKGATLSHHNVVNNTQQVAARLGCDVGGARICMSVPLYHCFGCVIGSVLAPLHGNAMVFPSQTFDAEASLKATEDERCTHLYGTPTMFVDMVNIAKQKRHDLSSVHSGVVAGAPVPFHLMQAMINDLNMRDAVVGYGLTECSPLLTLGFPSDDLEHRCGTVGYPLAHTELKVVDGQGLTAPVGQPGVLCARGYCNFLGYWDDAEKTAETLTPQRWLITGDVAVMNEDGYVKIVGRAKDMVIRGGENIYPTEVEDFLMTHPDVLEASAFGVPDDRMGEELAVWIRLRRSDTVSEHDIRSYCKGRIAHYKVPRYIEFRDDFPKTVTGKIQKFVMRDTMTRELGLSQ